MKRRAAPGDGGAAAPFSSSTLARRLRALAGPLRDARLCVAFSGGSDSTALLAALAALRARGGFKLRALHVNHHLQPGAQAWARAALVVARQLAVPCRVLDAPVVVARGESPEAAARTARYGALRADLRSGEWLLLAQHQDDQAETLLLQLLRGAGIAGLAAMPARAGPLLRPLLAVTREQLQDYLRRRGLPWTEDPSNADERYDRNYLRQRVLPLLRARWPSVNATVGRTAALAAEAQGLLAGLADAQLSPAHDGAALRVSVLHRLSVAERHNAVRRWLELRGLPMPDQRRLQEICGPLLRARQDAQPEVHWPGGRVHRHGARLHALAEAPPARPGPAGAREQPLREPLRWRWLKRRVLDLPGGARLELRPDPHGNLQRAALPDEVLVRFRAPDGAVGTAPGGKRLKGLLQAAAVPPWQRGDVPLLYNAAGRLLAVGELWRAPELGAVTLGAGARTPGSPRGARLRLRWRRCKAPGHPVRPLPSSRGPRNTDSQRRGVF